MSNHIIHIKGLIIVLEPNILLLYFERSVLREERLMFNCQKPILMRGKILIEENDGLMRARTQTWKKSVEKKLFWISVKQCEKNKREKIKLENMQWEMTNQMIIKFECGLWLMK